MKNMSVINGTFAVDFGDLDIIQEVITEDRDGICRLPGPPPPPPPPAHLRPHTQIQNLTQNHSHLAMHSRLPSASLPGTPSCPAPVLVARGTPSTRAPHAFPQTQPHPGSRGSMSSAQPSGAASQLGVARRGRGASGGSGTPRVQARPVPPQQAQTDTSQLERILERPRLVVTEEPKERGMRFRYECEGRSAGSILGTSSTETKKTLPTIEIQGPIQHVKKVKVTVSLVTKDIPHRPHPHCLVGKDCAEGSGICVVSFNPHKDRRHSFANLGIQCIRRKELDASLEKRRSLNIDPYKTGNTKSIEDMDMNVVRLCFQCDLEGEDGNTDSLSPVVSNPIYDKKATTTSELKINRLNEVKGSCIGKTEIYMLCDKVQKDDIEIIFKSGQWEAKGEFAQTDVHRQIAIVFKSPPYLEQDISEEAVVSVFLRRLSDHMESEPVTFTYLPHNSDPYGVTRKRKMKTDIGFSESVCVTGQNLAASDPSSSSSSSSQSLEPFPFIPAEPRLFPEEVPSAAPPGPSSSSSSSSQPGPPSSSSLGEIHYNLSTEDFSEEALLFLSLLESESLQAILSDPSLAGFANANSNFANMDVNFNLNLDGLGSGSGFAQQQDLSYYNDMRLQQMVNENQPALHPLGVPDSAPLDMDRRDNDRCGLVQVKMEEDYEEGDARPPHTHTHRPAPPTGLAGQAYIPDSLPLLSLLPLPDPSKGTLEHSKMSVPSSPALPRP